MSSTSFTHFVFVDFENVPGIDLDVLCDHPAVVLLFLGQKSKLKPALVEQMSRLPCEVRLIKVGETKKNALDFVLTYYLGAVMARHPEASSHIITGDKDYDSVIQYLATRGITVSKHASLEDLPFFRKPMQPAAKSKAPPQTKKPVEDRLAKLIESFKARPQHCPKKKATLIHHIATFYSNKLTDAEVADKVADLEKRGVINIDDKDKVTYC